MVTVRAPGDTKGNTREDAGCTIDKRQAPYQRNIL
jgi:hypothetical protein